MTQPTDGDSLKMWETEEGSISLSCERLSVPRCRHAMMQRPCYDATAML